MSLEVRQVVQLAREQFKQLLPEMAIVPPPLTPRKGPISPSILKDLKVKTLEESIRLEELEREGVNWAVTLSIPNPEYNPHALLDGIRNARDLARVAKVVVVDGEEGKLLAIRERAV